MPRVGQNHIYIYGVYTVFLAGKSPNIRSYTVYIYGSGQRSHLCGHTRSYKVIRSYKVSIDGYGHTRSYKVIHGVYRRLWTTQLICLVLKHRVVDMSHA